MLDEAVAVDRLDEVLAALRQAGIQPLLIKGLSIARHYPARGLRPACDIDLVVRRDELAPARAATPSGRPFVDYQDSSRYLDDRPDFRRRVRAIRIGAVEVKVLAPEDLLRLVCLHLLLHGGWRPLWLVDVAVLVERGEPLDADYLFAGDPARNRAVAAVLGVARDLLGAELPPSLAGRAQAPRWLGQALLAAWGADYRPYVRLARLPGNPLSLLQAAHRRWPNPIGATALLGGPYNDWPRLPIQLAAFALRIGQFLTGSQQA